MGSKPFSVLIFFSFGKESKPTPLRNCYLCSLKIEVICLYSTKAPTVLVLDFYHKRKKDCT